MIIWLILWFIICIPLIPPPLTFHQLLDLSSSHIKHQHNTNTTVNKHKKVFSFFLLFFVSFFTGFLLQVTLACMERWQMTTSTQTSHHYQCRANMIQRHEWPQRDRSKGGHGRGLETHRVEPGVFFLFLFFFTNIHLLCTAITPSFLYPTTTTAGLKTHQTYLELWNFFSLNKKPLLMLVLLIDFVYSCHTTILASNDNNRRAQDTSDVSRTPVSLFFLFFKALLIF